MRLEKLKWSTMPAPTDPKVWPCLVCRTALATHRRRLRQGSCTLNLIVCSACGQLPEAILWEHLEPKPMDPLDRIVKRTCD